MLFYRCFVLFSVFIVVKGYNCHAATPGESGYPQQCRRNFGCAMVRYVVDDRAYQTKDRARYMCVDAIAHLHPVFAALNCPHSSFQATCYDMFSNERVEFELSRGLKLEEQTVGEILRSHGIDRYCCCRGNECNKVNSAMMNHFNSQPSTFQETREISPYADFYPGGRIMNSDQIRYGSTALKYYPCLSLLFLTFYFAF